MNFCVNCFHHKAEQVSPTSGTSERLPEVTLHFCFADVRPSAKLNLVTGVIEPQPLHAPDRCDNKRNRLGDKTCPDYKERK